MKHTVLIAIPAVALLGLASQALAHRSGCHRWHSCPSDTGSYVCGDLGYTTFCGDTTTTPAQTTSAPLRSSTPSKPKYATKGSAYVTARSLGPVGGQAATLPGGWYRLTINGKQLRVRANSKSAWLGRARYALKAAPYVKDGQLFMPANVLTAVGCRLDTATLPFFVTVTCGDQYGLIDTTVW